MQLPRLPSKGSGIDAAWGRQVVSYLRAITLRPGTNYRVKTTGNGTSLDIGPRGRGGGAGSRPGPLQVSTARPPGTEAPWDDNPEATIPLHVWVWWGLVGGKIPNNIDDPVVIPSIAGRYWVYVEADVAQDVIASNTPLEILSAQIKATETANDPVPANPSPLSPGGLPAVSYYPLAEITVATPSGSSTPVISRINNTGSGSLGAYIYMQDLFFRAPTTELEAGMAVLKNIAWYRT